MIITTNVFPEFKTGKDLVRQVSKKHRFRTPFDNQHVKGSQTPVESAWQHFYQKSPSLWAKLVWKMYVLDICEILGGFLNTLAVHDKCPLPNCQNFPLPIQM